MSWNMGCLDTMQAQRRQGGVRHYCTCVQLNFRSMRVTFNVFLGWWQIISGRLYWDTSTTESQGDASSHVSMH